MLRVEHSRSASAETSPIPLLAPRGRLRSWSCLSPCEKRFLLGRFPVLGRIGLRPIADHGPSQAKDVLGDLRLPIGEEERYATIEGVYNTSTVADDGFVDLPADGMLDVCDADPERRVGSVQDEADLALLVAELLGHF